MHVGIFSKVNLCVLKMMNLYTLSIVIINSTKPTVDTEINSVLCPQVVSFN